MTYSDELAAEKFHKLTSQEESIQTTANWIMFHRRNHKDCLAVWNREVQSAAEQSALNLVYLANEVLQISRKRGPEFLNEFQKYLPDCFEHVATIASPQIMARLRRVVTIWQERSVFPTSFCEKLVACIKSGEAKNNRFSSQESAQLVKPLSVGSKFKFLYSFDNSAQFAAKCRKLIDLSAPDGLRAKDNASLQKLKQEEAKLAMAIESHAAAMREVESLLAFEAGNQQQYEAMATSLRLICSNPPVSSTLLSANMQQQMDCKKRVMIDDSMINVQSTLNPHDLMAPLKRVRSGAITPPPPPAPSMSMVTGQNVISNSKLDINMDSLIPGPKNVPFVIQMPIANASTPPLVGSVSQDSGSSSTCPVTNNNNKSSTGLDDADVHGISQLNLLNNLLCSISGVGVPPKQ